MTVGQGPAPNPGPRPPAPFVTIRQGVGASAPQPGGEVRALTASSAATSPQGLRSPSWTIRALSTCSLSSVSLRRCWLPGSSLSGQEWGVQGHGLAGQCWPEKAKRGGRAAETQGSLDRPLSCPRGAHAAHCGARAHTCAHTCSHLRCPSLPVPSRPEPAPGGHPGFLFSPLPL